MIRLQIHLDGSYLENQSKLTQFVSSMRLRHRVTKISFMTSLPHNQLAQWEMAVYAKSSVADRMDLPCANCDRSRSCGEALHHSRPPEAADADSAADYAEEHS